MRTARAVAFVVCAVVVAIAIGVPAARAQRRTAPDDTSRTGAQQKITPSLLTEIHRRRGDAAVRGIPANATGVTVDRHGRAVVDVRGRVNDPLKKKIGALGGRVLSSSPQYDQLIALMPVTMIERLAADASVRSINATDQR